MQFEHVVIDVETPGLQNDVCLVTDVDGDGSRASPTGAGTCCATTCSTRIASASLTSTATACRTW
ncbi:MAG: hypothetical protein KAX44_05320 [Candidatus Brocadiae bacterium]|nr:hypothetical protein [Candidatus Brocadiia bacterium]